MNINFEFLDNDAIENIITAMHYKMDKIVFFGEQESIDRNKKKTVNFLNKYCGINDVEFYAISQKNINSAKAQMERAIRKHNPVLNKLYFDITGGESIALVAFGMLSQQLNLPMHMFDVETDELIELKGGMYSISSCVPKQSVKLDIERYIEMQGGTINYNLHKNHKVLDSKYSVNMIEGMWQICKKHHDIWNHFANFLRDKLPRFGLIVNIPKSYFEPHMLASKGKFNNPQKLYSILKELEEIGAIVDLDYSTNDLFFAYENEEIRQCLCEGGAILELHTYNNAKKNSNDCKVAVHIDWDGVIHDPFATNVVDVLNEIDVISLHGNIPTYISCKSGSVSSKEAMIAMYELDTIARRFGGKYAKKALAVANQLRDVDIERAKEMKIEII